MDGKNEGMVYYREKEKKLRRARWDDSIYKLLKKLKIISQSGIKPAWVNTTEGDLCPKELDV